MSKQKEKEPTPLRPSLYFRKTVPYEHEIIAHDKLHPRLQREVKSILAHTQASRLGALNYGKLGLELVSGVMGGPTLNNATYWTLTTLILAGTGIKTIEGESNRKPAVPSRDFSENMKTAEDHLSPFFKNVFLPYSIPKERTKELEKVIDEIVETGQSPFARSDSPELLQKFHYGIVDNKGNVVLLKHPFDENSSELKGFEALKKKFAWKQKLQRTRFRINEPKIRAKEKTPVLKPVFTGASLALAPFRLKPRATRVR